MYAGPQAKRSTISAGTHTWKTTIPSAIPDLSVPANFGLVGDIQCDREALDAFHDDFIFSLIPDLTFDDVTIPEKSLERPLEAASDQPRDKATHVELIDQPESQLLTLNTTDIESASSQRTLMRRGAHSRCPLTSIVLGQIMSYPKMMLNGDQLPPFVHPPCHVEEELAQDCVESGKHVCLGKDLAVCASLVRSFYERTTGSDDFWWDTSRREMERLFQEVRDGCSCSAYLKPDDGHEPNISDPC